MAFHDVCEQPKEAILDVQRGIDGGEPVEQYPLEPPLMGEFHGTVEFDPGRFAGLGKHVDRPLVLEHEWVGEVVVALRAPYAAATTRRPDPLPRPRSPPGASA